MQILSAAVEGVIYDADRGKVLTMSELKKALVELVCGYLGGAGSAGPAELLSR